MKAASLVVVATTLALILALFLYVDPAEAAPKRRGGGGSSRRGSSSSSRGSSSWFGSSSKKNNYGGTNYGGGGYKKKGIGSKLKKAAVVGVGVYAGYQLGKLSAGYSNWGWGRQHGYGFNDWNRWREVDGFLCRETSDCSWVDPRLYCQDYELDFSPSRAWFGGDVARIVGECACPHGMFFNDREMRCESRGFFSGGLTGTALVLAVLIPLGLLACCCCVGVYVVRKFFQ